MTYQVAILHILNSPEREGGNKKCAPKEKLKALESFRYWIQSVSVSC